MARAAGKIYARVDDEWRAISGFWLERLFYVTCTHYYRLENHSAQRRDESAAQLKMGNINGHEIWVSSLLQSSEPGT